MEWRAKVLEAIDAERETTDKKSCLNTIMINSIGLKQV